MNCPRYLSSEDEVVKIKEEWKSAERIGEIRLGEKHFLHCAFFCHRFIPYDEIKQIYLRVESGEYGEFPVHDHHLIIVDKEKKEYQLHIDHIEDAKEVLKELGKRCPKIKIGIDRKKTK